MIRVEFTDYIYYPAGVREGVCVDNDNDIHNHNHNINHHLGELAAQDKYCQNTKKQNKKYLIEIVSGKSSPDWG